MPSLSIKLPKSVSNGVANSYLARLSVISAALILSRTESMCLLCSRLSFPYNRMSSMWQRTPGIPSSILLIILWKISGALDILKGSLLKQYCPNGVIKVVRSLEEFLPKSTASIEFEEYCSPRELGKSVIHMCFPENYVHTYSDPT